jgi:hypothetical protein
MVNIAGPQTRETIRILKLDHPADFEQARNRQVKPSRLIFQRWIVALGNLQTSMTSAGLFEPAPATAHKIARPKLSIVWSLGAVQRNCVLKSPGLLRRSRRVSYG